MSVHRFKASYWTSNSQPCCSYEVLVDGVEYRCNEHQLDLLYKGWDPVDLDLVRLDDDAVEERDAHYLRRP